MIDTCRDWKKEMRGLEGVVMGIKTVITNIDIIRVVGWGVDIQNQRNKSYKSFEKYAYIH